jgi:hypothetical protein
MKSKITLCKRQKLFCSRVRMETVLRTNGRGIFPIHLLRIYIALILWKIKLSTNVKSYSVLWFGFLEFIQNIWYVNLLTFLPVRDLRVRGVGRKSNKLGYYLYLQKLTVKYIRSILFLKNSKELKNNKRKVASMNMKKPFLFFTFLILIYSISNALTLDGILDASGYTLLYSTTANARTGFSGDGCSAIYYAFDANSVYFFVQGKIDGAGNGLLLLVGSSATSGYPAGYNLGNTNSGNAIFSLGSGSGGNWEMDFPVSVGIFLDSYNGNTTIFVNDAAYYQTGSFATSGFIGTITSNGQILNAPGSSGVSGCSLSFNTSGNTSGPGSSTGLEVAFPRIGSPLGNFTTAGATLQAFAIIVGNNSPTPGFFSNEGVPTNFSTGTTSAGNWGQNPNFGAGPCHITTAELPSGGAGGSSPTINGTLDASGYTLEYSTTTNARTGFAATECSAIYYTYDSSSVYFFVQAELSGSGDGIVLMVGSSATAGYSAGYYLGNVPSASGNGIFTLNNTDGDWAMDFPVNVGIFVDAYGGDTPSGSNLFYVNDAIYFLANSFETSGYIGGISSNGGVVTAPGNSGVSGAVVSINNSGNAGGPGNSTGLEVAFPRSGSALGSLTTGVVLEAFAAIVNNSGYFSNEGVPTNFPVGSADGFDNLGFDANFLAWGEENPGPNHVTTSSLPVPVELSKFEIE